MNPLEYYCVKYYAEEDKVSNDIDWFIDSFKKNYNDVNLKIEYATGVKIEDIEKFLKEKGSCKKDSLFYKWKSRNDFHIRRIKDCNEKNKKIKKSKQERFYKPLLLNDYVELKHIKQYEDNGFIRMKDLCDDKSIKFFLFAGKNEIIKELYKHHDDFHKTIINLILNQAKESNIVPDNFEKECGKYKEILSQIFKSQEIEDIIKWLPDFEMKDTRDYGYEDYIDFHILNSMANENHYKIDMKKFKMALFRELEKSIIQSNMMNIIPSSVKDEILSKNKKRL